MTGAVRCPRCRRGFSPAAADQPLERCPYCSASLSSPRRAEEKNVSARLPPPMIAESQVASGPTRAKFRMPLGLAMLLGVAGLVFWFGTLGAGVAYLSGWRPFASKAETIRNAMAGVVMVQGEQSMGTGFLVSNRQLVATNYHVIRDQESLLVKCPDGTTIESDGFIAVAPELDLAIIHLVGPAPAGKPFTIAEKVPGIGEEVRAIGSPRGLEGTVTEGVVSASRTWAEIIDLQGLADTDRGRQFDGESRWLQTSAPLSQGNSGGPLLNERAEVVGINTWQYSNDAGQNLNFAICSEHLQELVDSTAGHRPRPFADLKEIDDEYVEQRGLGKGTADEQCWFGQRRIIGNWYASNSLLAIGLWEDPRDGDTKQTHRARVLDSLRRAAGGTLIYAGDLKQLPVEKAVRCQPYVQKLIKHLEATAEQYTIAADRYLELADEKPESSESEWLKSLKKPQEELNTTVMTDGVALMADLFRQFKLPRPLPVSFSPMQSMALYEREQDVPPLVVSSVLTGGIIPYFRQSYVEFYDDPSAEVLLRFILKRWPDGHSLNKFAQEELSRRPPPEQAK